MYNNKQIDRINAKSGFVYVSTDKQKSKQQNYVLLQSEEIPLPSDSDAVQILVELIKNPKYTADELAYDLLDKITCKPESIARLLQYHNLEKKTKNC